MPLDGCYEVDEDGTHTVVGAEFNLSGFLDFMSGYDEPRGWLTGYAGGIPIYEYPDPVYSVHDVIRALANEVMSLRGSSGTPKEEA